MRSKIKKLYIFTLSLLSIPLYAQADIWITAEEEGGGEHVVFMSSDKNAIDYRDFDRFQETLLKEEVTEKINKYLTFDSECKNFYSITDESLNIFATKQDKDANKPEFVLRFKKNILAQKNAKNPQNKVIKNVNAKYPLKGMKIAIDPGHFGGDLASLEGRYIDMKPVPQIQNRTDIQFNEGTLTFLTAKELEKLLKAKGASVFLTRKKIGTGAYHMPFEQWMKKRFRIVLNSSMAAISDPDEREKQKEFWLHEANPTTIFRTFYNPIDLMARARHINNFKPDLSIIIHYNSDGLRDDETGLNIGTNANYNMVFVPGAFKGYVLANLTSRYDFVRMIVTNQIEDSIPIAQKLINEFTNVLNVDPIGAHLSHNVDYIKNHSSYITTGVYLRDLGISRNIESPLVYGESLLQDNYTECKNLVKKDVTIDGVKTSYRVKEVAQAYFNAVIDMTK